MHIENLLQMAMAVGASDLHLTVESPPMVRIKGLMCALDSRPLRPSDTEAFIERILDEQRLRRFQSDGEVSFSYGVSGLGRFRVMVFRQRGSITLAVRLVYPGIPSLSESNLPPVVGEMALRSGGLLLVTGPKGSGKSVALAGMIAHIAANRSAHILTLEDPVEFLHKHGRSIVNQREIHTDTPSFVDGLRAASRLDLDVLAVSDVPCADTVRLCLEAATSGCLVIAAFRSAGVESSLRSILSMFGSEQRPLIANLLGDCLEGAIGLRLIMSKAIGKPVPVCEVLLGTQAVRDIIREDRLHHIGGAMATGTRLGMLTIDQSCELLLKQQLVSDSDLLQLRR